MFFVTPAEVTPLIWALPTLLPTPPTLNRLSAEPMVISSDFIAVAEVSTVDTAVGAILPYWRVNMFQMVYVCMHICMR